jgi:hypothetical protein
MNCLLPSLLALEALLFLVDRLRWLPVGWPVLTAVGVYALTLLFLVAVIIAGLAFRWRSLYSVRSFLLIAAVGIIPFSWLTAEIKRAELQAGMVKTVDRLGGVTIDDLTYFSAREYRLEPPEPRWARALMGDDFFRAVPLVAFGGANLNDAQLAEVFNIPGIERISWLTLGATKITDAGLVGIRRCPALQTLLLQNSAITDAGLQSLYPLSQLRYLDLRNTGVTEKGVDKLQQKIPKCRIRH